MGEKTPLRVAVEDYIRQNQPVSLDVLTEKVGLGLVPAPKAVRERRAHLHRLHRDREVQHREVSTHTEVWVGTRSLVQKMLWSAARGRGATVRKRPDSLWEMIPEGERAVALPSGRPKKQEVSDRSLSAAHKEFHNRLVEEFEKYPIVEGQEAPQEHFFYKAAIKQSKLIAGQLAQAERYHRRQQQQEEQTETEAEERLRSRPPRRWPVSRIRVSA